MDALIQLREKKEACARELAVKEAVLQIKKNDLEKLQSNLTVCIANREHLETEEHTIATKLQTIENQIKKQNEQIKNINQANSSLQKELSGLFMFSFGKKKELKAQIDANERKISEARGILSSLHIQKSELERSMRNGALDAAIAQEKTIQQNIEALSSEIQEIEESIETISTSIDSIDQDIVAHNKILEDQRLAQAAEAARLAEEERQKKLVEAERKQLLTKLVIDLHSISKEKAHQEAVIEGAKATITKDGQSSTAITTNITPDETSLKMDLFNALSLFGRTKKETLINTEPVAVPAVEEETKTVEVVEEETPVQPIEEDTDNSSSLYQALLSLKSSEECWNFFGELLGPKEYQKLEQRAQLAKLLDCDVTYIEINKKTGASTATISRVNQVLQYDDEFHSVIMKNRNNRTSEPREYFGGLVIDFENETECKHFFNCLCSPVECQAMEQRFVIAYHLYNEKTYVQVTAETGASSATIGRVKSIIESDISIVRRVLQRMENADDMDTTEENSDFLYYQLTDVDAVGYVDKTDGFVIKKGSKVCIRERITCSAVTRRLRKEYASLISDKGILQEDLLLKSVNEATNFCAFGTASSTMVWKNKAGIPLRDLRKKQAEEAEKTEEARLAEEARKAEEARLAEEARKTEELSVVGNDEVGKIAIDLLGLSVRSYNCLKRANISFVDQMMSLSEEDLQGIRNMGRKSVQEILEVQDKVRSGEIDLNNHCNDGDEGVTIVNVGPLRMIEKAFPSLIGKKIGEIVFKNNLGIWNHDYDIEELGFSVRTVNCLKRAALYNISEVAMYEYDAMTKIKNMGKKSIDEVLEYLRDNSEARIEQDSASKKTAELLKYIKEVFLGECLEFDWNRHKRSIQSIVVDLVLNKAWDIDNTESNAEELLITIMKEEVFLADVEKVVLDTIRAMPREVSSMTLFARYPDVFSAEGLDEVVLESLIEKNCIERYKKGYRLHLSSIDEWVETLIDNRKQAFLLRVQGKTLQECGDIMNLTRERVRQLVEKACSQKPILREDDYGYWYSTYECDSDAMNFIFGIDDKTYNYLTVVYKKGTEPIEKMLEDSRMDSELYGKVHGYIYRNSIMIGNEYIPCKRELLCRAVAKTVCSDKDILSNELYDEYMAVLNANGISNDEKLLFPSARAFEARMQDSMYILMKYGRKLRYYSIAEYDISELIEQLNLERFQNIEITTLKLFREDPDLMEEYDIRDEYELHNLLKKTEGIWNQEHIVSITRMPFLVFGAADRGRQAEELLYQIAPVTLDEYGTAYEEEYGVLKTTVLANMLQFVDKYLHDGILSIDQPVLDTDEKVFLAEFLKNDFYFIEDVKACFLKRFGQASLSHLNPRTVKELGYKVYTNYLISGRYSSSSDYFTKMILRDTRLDLSVLDRRLIYVQQFNVALETLRSQLDVIEYDDGKYLTYSHFVSVLPEFDKDRLTEYIDETISYAKDKRYFTIKSLKEQGYDHELHGIGFGDWFNGALLKNSKKIFFVRVGGTILFYQGNERHTTVDFLRYVLSEEKSMDIFELVDYLNDEYGVHLQKEKIIQMIKESELYYDATMEKVYLDKEYFYEDF